VRWSGFREMVCLPIAVRFRTGDPERDLPNAPAGPDAICEPHGTWSRIAEGHKRSLSMGDRVATASRLDV